MSGEIKECRLLELLELYMDLVTQQDTIIYHLGNIIKKQETVIQNCKNAGWYIDDSEPSYDDLAIEEELKNYESTKIKLE